MMKRLLEPTWRSALRESFARIAWKALIRLEHPRSYEIESNGELQFLESWLLAQEKNKNKQVTILDCGANRGLYSQYLAKAAKPLNIDINFLLFEPQPSLEPVIRENLPDLPVDALIQAGVSSEEGNATLGRDTQGSALASLYNRGDNWTDKITIPLVRLDKILRDRGIETVDLLKLDVEGHEMEALKGLGDYWHPDRVKAIQFEYGGHGLDGGPNLKSFFKAFESRGYKVSKIMPHGLSVRKYKPWIETFENSNYVASRPGFFEDK